ncbi:MAG: D-alanine--D-alanine ligase [Synergistaceae bacterium]|jgi:D-alanine-D-alanine ligase|nr:D-alanine--D-alanine ligase [Synergistaceae bacterium]
MRIAVLCGGVSSEREVSLSSGAAVDAGLRQAGYDTVLEDVTSVSGLIKRWPELGADAAFIALHGGWGEDGRLQAALDAAGIKYTGSKARSCMMCMDKETSRSVMEGGNIPVPPGIAVRPDDSCDFGRLINDWERIVVKPASNGSTVGVAVTSDAGEASDALNDVWDIDTKAIVEKYVPGRELTAAVFGSDGDTFAMPAIDIRPRSGFYDYRSKYTKGASEYICPAPMSDAAARAVSEYAIRSHVLLNCRAYSRVDFRLAEDEGDIFVLEVNTAPGMTETSLVPKAALVHGWAFPELLREILRESCDILP